MEQDERRVLEAFRGLFAHDRGLGKLRPVDQYVRLFHGFESVVAREYARLLSEAPPAGGTPDSARRAPGDAAPRVDSAPPADRTIGPYRLLRELGRGGQAVVYLAEDARLNRNVALKVFTSGLLASEQFLERFRREVDAASRLDHPGICTVYEAAVVGDTPYIAMRHVEGMTLAQWIDASRAKSGEGPRTSSLDLPTPTASPGAEKPSVVMRVVALGEKTARALHAAHEAGLVHRDVKPGNVIVTREGEPVLLDFGLAREDDEGHTLTLTGALLGTPAYMSPEQILAQRIRVDCRTDVYSLGVTLYECLTLKRPFDAPTREGLYQQILTSEADSPRRLNPQVPRELVLVLETAMAKNRDRRYRSALEFAEDLRRLREHEPIHARPTPPLVRLSRWSQRHPAMATGAAAVFSLLVLGLVSTTHFLQRSRAEQGRTEKALAQRTQALEDARDATQRAEAEAQAKSSALAAETKALRHARSLALVGASIAAMPVDAMRALLLAGEAVNAEPSREAFDQLRYAIFNSRERAVLRGHSDVVNAAAFSAQGDRIVTASHDGTARVWDLAGKELSVLRGHTAEVFTAAFSPPGDRIVTASKDGTARVWDLSGTELRVLRSGGELVASAAFSPRGDRVVTVPHDATARVWDLEGTQLAVLRGHTANVRMASFSPNGDRIVTASNDGTARVFDAAGNPLAVLSGHMGEVWSAAFSPNGDRIATSSMDTTARLWDLAGGQLAVFAGHDSLVGMVRFAPQGDRIVTGSWDETARVWDLAGRQLLLLKCLRPVTAASFSPQGDRILTGSYDTTARVWDTAGRELAVLRGHAGHIASAVFSPQGDRILTSSRDRTARVWDFARKECAALTGHGDAVRKASFSARGDRIVTASEDGTARVWDAGGRELAVLEGHRGHVRDASFAPDGDRIVTASWDSTARLWDPAGRELAVLRGHPRSVDLAAFSPQGDRIVTGSTALRFGAHDSAPRVWDLAGVELAALKGHEDGLVTAAFSPQGDRIVTASRDRTARVWDLAGRELLVLRGHQDAVSVAAFSPQGDRIVTGSFDATARVWDLAGNELAVLRGSGAGLATAVYSPKGDRILTSSWEGDGRLWDPSGTELAVLKGHAGEIRTAVFSARGDRIVTASADGTARIWDLSGTQVAALRGHESPVLTAAFSPDDGRVVTASADGTALVWLVGDADVLALASERTLRELSRAEREQFADLLGEDNARALASFRALDALESLRGDAVLVSELIERVTSDRTLDASVRAEALRLAAGRTDDPREINRAAWEVVRRPGRSAEEYGLAVRRLGIAADLVPDDGDVANSLGVAQYRGGLYAEALATLIRSDAINARSKPPGIVEDVAFLAMCHVRLGATAEARRCLLRMRELLTDAERAAGPDAADFAREAEALVGGD